MAELTKQQKKSYVNGGYNCCPHCHSTDIDSTYESKDDNWVECNVVCNNCDEEWSDVYTLSDIKT